MVEQKNRRKNVEISIATVDDGQIVIIVNMMITNDSWW